MKKNITAIILVFAMLAGFASCKKLENEGEWVIESKVYVTDSYGAQHDVEAVTKTDGETEYYYYNTDGNKVTVAQKDVVVSTTKVFKPAPTTLTPEEQSFFEAYTDPEAFKELIEETMTQPEFEISDELVPEEEVEEVTNVEINDEGKPVRNDDNISEILESDEYTVEYVVKTDYNGEMISVPVYMTKDGEDIYMSTGMPVDETNIITTEAIIIDKECYLVVPTMKAYFKMTAEQMGEATVISPDVIEQEYDSNYVKSGQLDVDGVVYDVDFYEADGQNIKCFYKSDELKRVEIDDGNENATIIEFKTIKKGADKSKIKVPTGYLDLTSRIGQNFDPNNLITQ